MKADGLEWKDVKLGSILHYLDERITMDEEREYLTITVKRRHGGLEIREKLFGHQIATKKQFKLVPGALIISRVQCWHQAYAIVGDVPPNAIASTNYDQFAISTDVDSRFFWWLSHSPAFTETVRSSAVGVVIEKMVFNRDEWLSRSVSLPPLEEQRRIVARIEELAVRIGEARTLRQRAEEEAEALLQAQLNIRVRQLLQQYENAALESVTTFIGDMNHEMPSAAESGIPFVSPRDFKETGIIDFRGAKRISESDFARLSTKCRPRRGDILMARYGTIGEARIVETDQPFLASYSIAVISPDQQRVEARFLYWMIISPDLQAQALVGIRGGIQADLGLKTIRQFVVPVPSLSEQHRIVAELDALQAQVDELKRLQAETAVELDALLPSILDRAFKGEL